MVLKLGTELMVLVELATGFFFVRLIVLGSTLVAVCPCRIKMLHLLRLRLELALLNLVRQFLSQTERLVVFVLIVALYHLIQSMPRLMLADHRIHAQLNPPIQTPQLFLPLFV